MDKNEIKQRDRPRLGQLLARLWERRGAGLLLLGGAAAITIGAALIYPPAGWITGGLASVIGGVLSAIGGESR